MRIAILALLCSFSLTVVLVYLWFKHGKCACAEGFEADKVETPKENLLLKMIKQLTHMSKYFADTDTWKHRITTAFMSPIELARYNLQQEAAAKKAAASK